MKNGKKPTREHRKIIMQHGLNPIEWLVIKAPPDELHIISKANGAVRVLKGE